ncbi:hypothetical protein BCV73_11285 [Paenibacillus sp. SSG-1]|nr:hypothetical protein BCV73_11285 [Paenibacillus sp. SSG-1]
MKQAASGISGAACLLIYIQWVAGLDDNSLTAALTILNRFHAVLFVGRAVMAEFLAGFHFSVSRLAAGEFSEFRLLLILLMLLFQYLFRILGCHGESLLEFKFTFLLLPASMFGKLMLHLCFICVMMGHRFCYMKKVSETKVLNILHME